MLVPEHGEAARGGRLHTHVVLAVGMTVAAIGVSCAAAESRTADPTILARGFDDDLDGWEWIREDPTGWRVVNGTLRIRSDPGALAIDNDNRNMPLRPAPQGAFVVEVTLRFEPEGLYEQAGLVLYGDDDNYVKLQYERVEAGRGVTFTRENQGEFLDMGFIPLEAGSVQLRLEYRPDSVLAQARRLDVDIWTTIGATKDPPAGARVGLATGAGSAYAPRWASYSEFVVAAL